MPTLLREHQHEITSEDGSLSLLFGTEDTGYLTLSRPVITAAEVRTSDVDLPQEDGRRFGRDYLSAKTVTFDLGVLTDRANTPLQVSDPYRANLDTLDAFEAVWADEMWRNDPQAYAVLRSHEAGQTWRCYGRPGRYEPGTGVLTEQGYSTAVAEFRLHDDRWYSDVEHRTSVTLLPSGTAGGLIAPLRAPLASVVAASSQTGQMTVAGSRPTWLVYEFHGPVANPRLRLTRNGVTLEVGLTLYIPDRESVIVDTRPWARSVVRASDGAGLPGALSRRTPALRSTAVRPGVYQAVYTGQSESGSSYCEVRWRDARGRP